MGFEWHVKLRNRLGMHDERTGLGMGRGSATGAGAGAAPTAHADRRPAAKIVNLIVRKLAAILIANANVGDKLVQDVGWSPKGCGVVNLYA
jgi:hypothetical protein